MLVNRPCAYCGSKIIERTKGHVLPKSIYPDSLPNAKRITVAECLDCKTIWEDAEPHFKNVILSIWNADILPSDSRVESMMRGFQAIDGQRRAKELLALIESAYIDGKKREKIYPAKDSRFNLILRRIVRGLIDEHKLGTSISDERVYCDVMLWQIPPAFEADLKWHVIADGFFRYAYSMPDDASMHSFWLLQFSKNLLFFGAVEPAKGAIPAGHCAECQSPYPSPIN